MKRPVPGLIGNQPTWRATVTLTVRWLYADGEIGPEHGAASPLIVPRCLGGVELFPAQPPQTPNIPSQIAPSIVLM